MADVGGNYVNPAYATPAQRQQLYDYAKELMKPQPIANWAQGVSSLAHALVGGNAMHDANVQSQDAVTRQQQLETPLYAAAGNLGGGGSNPASQVAPGPQAGGGGIPPEQEAYIRQAAATRGIDPETAVAVAKSEGLGGSYAGDNGSSFGPFQLHYGGVAPGGNSVGGLGDDFTKATGLDARDPSTWKAQTDFALDNAAKGGWGPWHGAAAAGIAPNQGIGAPPQGGGAPPQPGVQLAGPVPTPDTGARPPQAAPQPPAPQAIAPQAGPQGSRGGITPQQAAAIMASPETSPETRHMVMALFGPQILQDPYGGNHPYVPVQGAAAPSATPQAHFGSVGAGPVHAETVTVPGPNGAPQTQLAIPGGGQPQPGASGSSNGMPIGGPLDALAPLVKQGQAMDAQGSNNLTKQAATSARYQAAQEAGPQLIAASYPLRQLQAIIARNGGMIPSGEGSEKLMAGLSVGNMLGTLIGHPIAAEDSTLPTLELLKKYGMQAAQAQSQALGLHTNLGLESASITSPNPSLSGPANAHLVDNLVRLNQVAQKKAAFEHDLFLKNGQGPDAYDNATSAWQEATAGKNAIPLASGKFGHSYTNPNGQKRVIVPSTDPSGFSVYAADDPLISDAGPQGK